MTLIAVDQESRQILAECQLQLSVIGPKTAEELKEQSLMKFPAPFIALTVPRREEEDTVDGRDTVELVPFQQGEYRDNVRWLETEAWDDAGRRTTVPKVGIRYQ